MNYGIIYYGNGTADLFSAQPNNSACAKILKETMLSKTLHQLTENKLKGGDQCRVIQLHSIKLNQVVNPTIQLQSLISSSELFNLI